jgi:hypothetical protein
MTTSTSNEPTSATNTPAKKTRSGWLIVGGVAALVAVLVFAGGALVVGRFSAPSGEGDGGRVFGGGARPEFQIQPAKELPTSEANVRGIVTARDGNTFSVGQRGGFGGNSGSNTNLTTVVVAPDTTIYHDTTQMGFNGQPPNGPVQQTVEPGTVDGISTNSRVTVWGEQNGNQITAKVLVYSDPINFRQP